MNEPIEEYLANAIKRQKQFNRRMRLSLGRINIAKRSKNGLQSMLQPIKLWHLDKPLPIKKPLYIGKRKRTTATSSCKYCGIAITFGSLMCMRCFQTT